MSKNSETQAFWDVQGGKLATISYSEKIVYESPDDIPLKISKNELRCFILSILKEKGLLKEGE